MLLHSKIFNAESPNTPLIIIHGLFGMLDNWGTLAKHFAENRPVHLLDLRNHGRSFHHPEMNLAAMAEDLKHYLDHHHIAQAHLLGHSLGGKKVMEFAMHYPQRIQKLIVADMAPKAYPPHHQSILKALQTVDFAQHQSRQAVQEHLAGFIAEAGVIQFLMKNLYWNDEKQLAWRFNLPVLCQRYPEFVGVPISHGQFDGPCLFLAGALSHYVLPQDKMLIQMHFPKADVHYIAGAAHWLHADKPQEFLNAVQAFLY
jgi:esterase